MTAIATMEAEKARPLPASLLTAFVSKGADGEQQLDLLVEGVHCANCIRTIETGLKREPYIRYARVNLTMRRLSVSWTGPADRAEEIGAAVRHLGYQITPYDPGSIGAAQDRMGRELLRSLAIAGFASANVMMLAWAVWSGQAQGMGQHTQAFFNWLSALVGVPALIIAGRPFFRSAFGALKAKRTNIDVPIAAALILTAVISLLELLRHGEHVYFDSATMLLFVLLIGRYLDFRVRARSREAIERLAMMRAEQATVVGSGGETTVIAASAVEPGMLLRVGSGETLPVDGIVESGVTDLDRAAVTGETMPEVVGPGDTVLAGCVNGAEPLFIRATKPSADSHLAQILRLVEQAQLHKGSAATQADRLSAIWTPFVHGIGLLTFFGWWIAGTEIQTALLHAVTVLIIACPCAIGLAIPAVQVATIGGLLRRGILVRSGDALDRLASVNAVVFDKTGTLTTGRPEIVEAPSDAITLHAAASLARGSRHPYSRTITARLGAGGAVTDRLETVGAGISGSVEGRRARLGSAEFCGVETGRADEHSEVWVKVEPMPPARFAFADPLRADAAETVAFLSKRGLALSLLSGDRPDVVRNCAKSLGIESYQGGLKPEAKSQWLIDAGKSGARTLMIGDGLNDAPALSTAHVSASFGHGVPVTQVAADFVLPADNLSCIALAYRTARKAARIVRQNLGFAAAYNLVLIPVAVFGFASPLIAAAAMSASSIVVTLNALRAQPPKPETTT